MQPQLKSSTKPNSNTSEQHCWKARKKLFAAQQESVITEQLFISLFLKSKDYK